MKREDVETYFYYAAVAILTVGAYYFLNTLGDGAVKALLDFYKTVIELFFNNALYYDQWLGRYVSGYYNSYYAIGKECLGLNVIVLLFGVCGVLSVKALRGRKRIPGIIASAAAAVVAGVGANILRLLSSIYFISFVRFELIHALLGVVIYLTVLICFHGFFIRLNKRSAMETVAEQILADADAQEREDIEELI